jgi:hypothetical protein
MPPSVLPSVATQQRCGGVMVAMSQRRHTIFRPAWNSVADTALTKRPRAQVIHGGSAGESSFPIMPCFI